MSLRTLASDSEDEVRCGVALNPGAPENLLRELSEDRSGMVRSGLAMNERAPSDVLAALGTGPDLDSEQLGTLGNPASISLHTRVAMNPATPVLLLRRFATDHRNDVRWGVARNLSTPPDLLEVLAEDVTDYVRAGALANPMTPTRTLAAALSRETNGRILGANGLVLAAMAGNPGLTPELVDQLIQRQGLEAELAENPATPADVLTNWASSYALAGAVHVHALVAGNTSSPQPLLAALSRSPYPEVRKAVAGNTSAAAGVLDALASDPDELVVHEVAGNRSIPASTLRSLYEEHFGRHGYALASNPSFPAESMLEASAQAVDWDDWELVATLAANRSFPKQELSRLSASSITQVRWAVAMNPATPW